MVRRVPLEIVRFLVVVGVFAFGSIDPMDGQVQDAVVTNRLVDHRPLEGFGFYIGKWEHPDRPMTVTMEWVFEHRVVEWSETGAAPGATTTSLFARGLIGYDAADEKIVFHDFFGGNPGDFFGQRQMMFHGEYEILGDNRLQRMFVAHYGEGWDGRPAAKSKIEFRETWEPAGPDGWRWTSEIRRNDEWSEYQPPVVMRRVRN